MTQQTPAGGPFPGPEQDRSGDDVGAGSLEGDDASQGAPTDDHVTGAVAASDDRGPDVPGEPDDVTDSGTLRALGERRRRRSAERAGQLDLDTEMSRWPAAEPPTHPRPVVRPARPTVDGVADAPLLPTPGWSVVAPLLEERHGSEPVRPRPGSRRSLRRRAAAGREVAGVPADPVAVAAVAVDPALVDPVAVDPAAVDPAAVDPAAVDPAAVDPVALEPASDEKVPADAAPGPFPDGGATTVDGLRAGSTGATGVTGTTGTTGITGAAAGPSSGPPSGSRPGWSAARRSLLLVVGGLLLLLVLVVALVAGLVGEDDATGAATPSADPTLPQQTLSVGLTGPDGGVVAAAVLGVDAASLSTVLLPADLLLTVADANERSLAEAAALGPDSLRRGIEDTLLLSLDGTLLLQPQQLSALVDVVGGVVVDVDADVVTDTVVVPAGVNRTLTGDQAAAYAGLQVEGEPVEARLARFGDVLGATLTALPTEQAATAEVLRAAGVAAATFDEDVELDALLAQAADRTAAETTRSVVLPTTVRTAGDTSRRGLDESSAQAELEDRFAGARLPLADLGEVRVFIRNGVAQTGLVGRARDELVAAGLRYVGGGNAATFDQRTTAVLVASQEPADREQGLAVADALGLGEEALMVDGEATVDSDVVVVLGEDYASLAAQDSSTSEPTTTGESP